MKKRSLQFLKKQSILFELTKLVFDDTHEIYNRITQTTADILNVERVSIWLFNEERSEIKCEVLYTKSLKKHQLGISLSISEFPRYFKALQEFRFISADDASNDPRSSEFTEKYHKPLNIKSMLDVPVRVEGVINAILCCEQVGVEKAWTNEEEDFASSMADIISLLIQTANRRKIETELRKSEEKYRKIVDNAVIGIYKSDFTGQFLFLNQAMANIFEFDSIKEGMLYNIEKLYKNPEDRKDLLTRLIQDRIVHDYELKLVTVKGKMKYILLSAFYEEDKILGMVVDITERKKSEEELKNARNKAEESDRLKTSLLANMNHEFRTPMNAILGFSDLILTESQDTDVVFFARKIHKSGLRLMSTLKAILDLADLEATRSKIRFIPINVQRILTTILYPFYTIANEKGLYLITEYKENLFAYADENLLQMTLHNLIDNAIKFTSSGGVTIETDLSLIDEKKYIVVRVKDTGIGIHKEYLEQIFHEFRQVSEGYNRSHEGTGLGLSLAYRMIEMLHGKIVVESEYGLGSIFTLWVPAREEKEQTSVSQQSHSTEDHPSKTFHIHKPYELPVVLIVEDNNDNAEILKLYLKGKYKTERASDALSGIKMAAEHQYSCILMDINLGPGMDGLTAAKEIRKLTNYQDIPIIAITGYTMAGDRERLLSGGCDYYLGKPFSQQGLDELMAEVFSNN